MGSRGAVSEEVMNERGASLIEYAILVVVIACVAVLGFELLGISVRSLYDIAGRLP
jgi:Flp pilus assembly pilin Flp